MDRKGLLLLIAISVAASGCIHNPGSASTRSGEVKYLSDVVLNGSEVPENFELTHSNYQSGEEYNNSGIEWRVHRRFVSENNQAVILSSATIHESNEFARRFKRNQLSRTPGETFTANISGVNTTMTISSISPKIKLIQLLHLEGNESIFVGVKNTTYSEDFARKMYTEMIRDIEN